MAAVVTGLEGDVVGTEQPVEDLLARREHAVDLARGERDVQEEADRQVGARGPQHRGDEHQVEVVHPDAGARPAGPERRGGETAVDRHVLLPRALARR